MNSISSLGELIAQIDDLAGAMARNSAAVTRASVDRWFLNPAPTVSYVPSIRMQWKVSFIKTKSSSVFWFFKNTSTQRTLIDASIDVGMDSIPAPAESGKPAVDDLQWEFVYPSFIWLDITDEGIAKFGLDGSTRENTIFLRTGEEGRHVLAVLVAPKLKQCRVRYSPNGIPAPTEPVSGRYPLLPFLDLIGTMRSWLGRAPGAGNPIARAAPKDDKPVQQILRGFAEAYARTWSSLAEDPARALPPPLRNIHEVSHFGTDMKLRLKADGTLAEKEKDERFQLQLSLRIAQHSGHVAQLWVAPPDFLISGVLYDAFFDELIDPGVVNVLAREFNIHEMRMRQFLDSARTRSSIFRVDRDGDYDLEILVLTGELAGRDTLLMFGAEFKVNADQPTPKVRFGGGDIAVIASHDRDPRTLQVGFDEIEYFLRLLTNMKRWSELF